MKFANPILCAGGSVYDMVTQKIYTLTASCVFFRIEPEFIFEEQQLDVSVSDENRVHFSISKLVSRNTIVLFIPLPDLQVGTYQVRVSSAGREFMLLTINALLRINGIESAAAAGAAETKFARDRYALQSLPFEEMLSKTHDFIISKRALLIYVTGSVGKTTTKELLAFALQGRLRIAKSSDSWNFPHEICSQIANNLWADVFIMEASLNPHTETMGKLLPPQLMIFTEVGAAHTQTSLDLHQIAAKKFDLAKGMSSGGKMVANIDNEYINAALVSHPSCDLLSVSLTTESRADVQVIAGATETLVITRGRKLYLPSLPNHVAPMVFGCALAAYLLIDHAPDALENFLLRAFDFPPVTGRMDVSKVGRTEILNDAYNANPVSMRRLFSLLDRIRKEGKKILLIIGNMADLGSLTVEMHRIIFLEARAVCDCLVVTGEFFTAAAGSAVDMQECVAFPDASSRELLRFMNIHLDSFDIIALKGSNTSGLFKLAREFLSRQSEFSPTDDSGLGRIIDEPLVSGLL